MAAIVLEVIICWATLEAECVLFCVGESCYFQTVYTFAYGVCLPLSSPLSLHNLLKRPWGLRVGFCFDHTE